jgi:hypothetical protein
MDQFSLLILIALALGIFWKIRKDQELPILAEIQQALRKERELLHAKGNNIRALEFDRMIDAIQTGIAVAHGAKILPAEREQSYMTILGCSDQDFLDQLGMGYGSGRNGRCRDALFSLARKIEKLR